MDQADRLRSLASPICGDAKTPRIISVTSGKGGVGKTNIAVNLALSFSRRGFKTLLIDSDFGLSNVSILLGKKVCATLDDVLHSNAPMSSVFVKSGLGFDFLPSAAGVRDLLELDAFLQRTLLDKLAEASQNYQIVIFDTAPGLGSHVLDINAWAQDILIVAHAEPTALADAYSLIKVLATEKKEKKFKLILNRVRSAQEGLDSYRRVTEVTDEFLNVSVDYLGALPEDSGVLRSVRAQEPILSREPFAPFAVGIERVTDKLLASKVEGIHKKSWHSLGSGDAHSSSLSRGI
jgi:flagellar biosynthesis protein FlhG